MLPQYELAATVGRAGGRAGSRGELVTSEGWSKGGEGVREENVHLMARLGASSINGGIIPRYNRLALHSTQTDNHGD